MVTETKNNTTYSRPTEQERQIDRDELMEIMENLSREEIEKLIEILKSIITQL